MASQTMLSSSSIRGSIPGASQFQPRQSSVYSLTLDEGQDHLDDAGISLSSMNMDDLLKNMWPMEGGGQSTAGLSDANAIAPAASSSPALQLQGGVTLPRTLSRKTVDEVWKDIQKNNSHNKRPQGQGTFGEMTLEDFLVKSGVAREDGTSSNAEVCLEQNVNGSIFNYATASQSGGMDAMVAAQNLQHAEWLQFQYKTAQQHPQQQPPQRLLQQHSPYAKQASQHTALVISSNNPTGGTANNLTFCSSVMDTSSSSPPRGKKRAPESTMEKTVERPVKFFIWAAIPLLSDWKEIGRCYSPSPFLSDPTLNQGALCNGDGWPRLPRILGFMSQREHSGPRFSCGKAGRNVYPIDNASMSS
eukprot:Gb_16239 [translate_table: standard]